MCRFDAEQEMLLSSMLDLAEVSTTDVHEDDVIGLLLGKAWVGSILSGSQKCSYSFTVNLDQVKRAGRYYLEGIEYSLLNLAKAPPGSGMYWNWLSITLHPWTSSTVVTYNRCSMLLDPDFVHRMVGEGCSRAKESLELYASDVTKNHRACVGHWSVDFFLSFNGEGQFPFYRTADPVCTEAAREQWEEALCSVVESGTLSLAYVTFSMIQKGLSRILTVLDLAWGVTGGA